MLRGTRISETWTTTEASIAAELSKERDGLRRRVLFGQGTDGLRTLKGFLDITYPQPVSEGEGTNGSVC
jgi:hypothetical protein